jgi:hypothetical protein
MGKQELIKSAGKLKQPSTSAANEFEEKSGFLAAEMNKIISSRSDLNKLIGSGNNSMMEDNHRNHARFMSSVFISFDPNVLVETVLWVFRAYRSHGFKLTYWPAQLDQWVELFKIHLSEKTFNEIYPFYNWMIINQPEFVAESDKLISGSETPSHENIN